MPRPTLRFGLFYSVADAVRKIRSHAYRATINVGALVFPEVIDGNTDASTTNSRSNP